MVTVRRRLYDPEKQKVLLELAIEIPGGGADDASESRVVVLKEAGSVPAIARRLAARFALPVDPKDLAENMADQVAAAPLAVKNGERDDEEGDAYFAFHCWLTERGERLLKEQKLWFVPAGDSRFAARFTEEACRDFLRYAGIAESDRRAVLRHWRDRGWLRVNNPGHLRKRVRVAHAGGPYTFLEFYEVVLSDEFPVDETLGAGGPAAEGDGAEIPVARAAAG